jgi:Flp pilus assembly protein TadB
LRLLAGEAKACPGCGLHHAGPVHAPVQARQPPRDVWQVAYLTLLAAAGVLFALGLMIGMYGIILLFAAWVLSVVALVCWFVARSRKRRRPASAAGA